MRVSDSSSNRGRGGTSLISNFGFKAFLGDFGFFFSGLTSISRQEGMDAFQDLSSSHCSGENSPILRGFFSKKSFW